MKQLILIILLLSPFFLIAQNPSTEQLMAELGYKKVDLETLKEEQLKQAEQSRKKACSSCPNKVKITPLTQMSKRSKEDILSEIDRLENQLIKLDDILENHQKAPNADPKMTQKYKTSIDRIEQRIELLKADSSLD